MSPTRSPVVECCVDGNRRSPTGGRVLTAAVTPLASILGSGLLIIVPVLERTLGALSVFGAIGVCGVAWLAGTAIRHCVRVVEPLATDGKLDTVNRRVDRAADAVIVVAYVISVALYLRIMAQYVVAYATGGNRHHLVRRYVPVRRDFRLGVERAGGCRRMLGKLGGGSRIRRRQGRHGHQGPKGCH